MTPTKAFAAYQPEWDWIPMSGIGQSMEYCQKWIDETYLSGHDKWQIVPVIIRVQKPRMKTKNKRKRRG